MTCSFTCEYIRAFKFDSAPPGRVRALERRGSRPDQGPGAERRVRGQRVDRLWEVVMDLEIAASRIA